MKKKILISVIIVAAIVAFALKLQSNVKVAESGNEDQSADRKPEQPHAQEQRRIDAARKADQRRAIPADHLAQPGVLFGERARAGRLR